MGYSNISPTDTTIFNRIGTISHFNGFIFNDLIATQADCEGALAVGGNVTLGSPGHGYDVGFAGLSGYESIVIGKYENPEHYPTFLLGGKASEKSTETRIHAGSMMIKSGYWEEFDNSNLNFDADTILLEDDEIIYTFFQYAKEQSLKANQSLRQSPAEKISPTDLRRLNTLNTEDYLTFVSEKNILIYEVDSGTNNEISIGEIYFNDNMLKYDAIIITSQAAKVAFADGAVLFNGSIVDTSLPQMYEGNKVLAAIAKKVVYNLPNAEEINISGYGVAGSILAPSATVTAVGGSINGMLVANNFNQKNGAEIHAFSIAISDVIFGLEILEDTGSIIIYKIDSDLHFGLEDAEFELYAYEEDSQDYTKMVAEATSDEDGFMEIDSLIPGKYKLIETKAPRGYAFLDGQSWLFEVEQNSEGEIIDLQTLYIENSLSRGTVAFLKLDYDNHNLKLTDAVFALYAYDEEAGSYSLMEENLTTGDDGLLEILDLLPGKYRLAEVSAPTGYYLAEEYHVDFEIALDENGELEEYDVVEIFNHKLAELEIIKVDYDNRDLKLEGAVFDFSGLNNETGEYENIFVGLVSDENGIINLTGLEPGKYKLTETAAPEGYFLPDENETLFSVTVDSDGRLVVPNPITISNKQLGQVQIIKIDSDDDRITLEGAVFDLYRYEETFRNFTLINSDLVTGSDGILLIKNLAPGEYKLVETACPRGYCLPDNPETLFTVVL